MSVYYVDPNDISLIAQTVEQVTGSRLSFATELALQQLGTDSAAGGGGGGDAEIGLTADPAAAFGYALAVGDDAALLARTAFAFVDDQYTPQRANIQQDDLLHPFQPAIQPDDTFYPVQAVGSMGRQDADNVAITGGTARGITSLRLNESGGAAIQGAATLVAGTVTVNTTAVTANSRIFMNGQNSSGTHGELTISARVAGTSFTITSTSATDTRLVAWFILEP